MLGKRLALLILTTAVIGTGCGTPRPAPSPAPKGTLNRPTGTTPTTGANRLQVIAFYDEGSDKTNPAGFPNLQSFPHLITYLSPFWYKINPDGNLQKNVSNRTLAFAKKSHLALMPLFTNAGGNSTVLMDPTTTKRAVTNMVNEVVSKGYAGASLDFELLPPSARAGLTHFSNMLATDLKAKGRRHTVNIIPQAQTMSHHGAYNQPQLSRNSDGIILMTYDHHSDSSPAGAVAPLPWVRDSVNFALRAGVPASKIFLGVATYGYDWASNGQVTTVPLKTVRQMGVTPIWDPTAMEYHFTYNKNGVSHQVWFEDERSVRYKVALAKRLGLRGIAIWRMGYEDRPYWTSLERDLQLTPSRLTKKAVPGTTGKVPGGTYPTSRPPGGPRPVVPSKPAATRTGA